MKFAVSRTSLWNNKRPCEEAYLDKYVHIEDGHIKRDFPAEGWFIDLDTDGIIEFVKKYGDIVIHKHYENPNYLEIEIYDNWRE